MHTNKDINPVFEQVKDHYLVVCWDCPEEAVALQNLGVPVIVYDPRNLLEGQGIVVAKSLVELLGHLVRRGGPNDFPLVLCPDSYVGTEEHTKIHELCYEACITKKIKENTRRDRMRNLMECLIENIPRAATMKHMPGGQLPFQGLPVFIVSAGPSLDKNGHLLKEARKKGVVMTVNTAVRPVIEYCGKVDVCVTIEAKSSSHHLDGTDEHVETCIADLGAHPNTLAWADARPNSLIFSPHHALVNQTNYLLGLPSTSYGASVATAAFTVALNWGASDIIMVGQDCAYADDGRIYAKYSAYEDLRWEETLDGQILSGKGSEHVQKLQPKVMVEHWSGQGKAITVSDLQLFARWFSGVAASPAVSAKLWNCTEGGVRLDGFHHTSLKRLLKGLQKPKASPTARLKRMGKTVPKPIVLDLLNRMSSGLAAAERYLDAGRPVDAMNALQATPILREYLQVWQQPEKGKEGLSRVMAHPEGAPLYWSDGVATVNWAEVVVDATRQVRPHLDEALRRANG